MRFPDPPGMPYFTGPEYLGKYFDSPISRDGFSCISTVLSSYWNTKKSIVIYYILADLVLRSTSQCEAKDLRIYQPLADCCYN